MKEEERKMTGEEATEERDSPAEAEESQVEAQQRGHHVSDEGAGLTGVEVQAEPHGRQQGKQLAHYKVHLEKRQRWGSKRAGQFHSHLE